jgi:hypothetical protein
MFGAADLDELLTQTPGTYLARKFDATHDRRVFDLLDATLWRGSYLASLPI